LINVDTEDAGWAAAERALALQPDLAEAHAAKGRILGDAGRYDEALVEHTTALRLDPDGYEVNCGAARCYIGMRRNRDAIGYLEKAAAAIETDFWALGMAIQCYNAVGDGDGAKSAARRCLERVEKAIVAEPDHGLAMGFGVSALVALHEVDRAKEWVARARLLDPDNRNLNYILACNMVKLGEFDMALELLAPHIAQAQRQNLLWYESDTTLDPIRNDPRYEALIAKAEARVASTQSR
jgi:adenylate cyclase